MNYSEKTCVKKPKLSDLSEVFKISCECNLGSWSEKDYRDELQRIGSVILVAELQTNKAIVGFILARLSGLLEAGELDIINIGILEAFRRQGIGEILLKKTLNYASEKNVDSIWLEVRESNSAAIKFYKKHGFIEIQIRKGFYTNPTDNALVMKLNRSNV